MRIKALLFDLDGTLIDSKRDIINEINRTLKQYGIAERSERELERGIGNGAHSIFRSLLEGDSRQSDEALIHEMVLRFRANYRAHMADNTRVFPGVWDVLQHFKSLPKVIITNKSQASADAICGHLGLTPLFSAIHGPEAFATHKPDPGPILETCARLGVLPSETAFIGDTTVDMAAGQSAGAISVAALYGYGQRHELLAASPSRAIEKASELIDLLAIAD